MINASVIGPGPGSAGGVGVMTGYLAATSSERTRLEFWESGGAPGPRRCRLQSFFSAAIRCLQPHASRVQVFSVASRGSTWRKLILTSLVRLRSSPYVPVSYTHLTLPTILLV